ncbi:MAG: hypothetical protein AAGI30_05595 [Planctomycetota bacterium]
MRTAPTAFAACVVSLIAGSAAGATMTVTFGPGDHGEIVDGRAFGDDLFTVSATNFRHRVGGSAQLFDPLSGDTARDEDLLGAPFSKGNLVDAEGNLLVGVTQPELLLTIADYLTGSESDGIVDQPSDEGSRRNVTGRDGVRRSLTGEMVFSFDEAMDAERVRLGIVDTEKASINRSALHLVRDGAVVQTFSLNPTVSGEYGTPIFGDNSYNEFVFVAAQDFDEIVFEAGGSLGVSYVGLDGGTLIPSPGGAIAIVTIGGIVVARRRR